MPPFSSTSGGGCLKRRLATTLADQVVSSASNFLVVLAVARISTVAGFGAFSLAFLVSQMALGLMRAGGGDVLLIRSSETGSPPDRDPHRALSFVFAFALAVAAGMAVIGTLVGGEVSAPLTAIAVVLVPVLLEDCYRYVFFAHSSPHKAIVIDTVWLLAQLLGFVLASEGVVPQTPAALILIWGAGAALACLCAAAMARVAPGIDAPAWVRAARHRVAGLMADFMLLTGTSYLGVTLIPLVASLPVVAALRGAQFLFNPFVALLASVRVVALPVLARQLAQGSSAAYRRTSLSMSGALSVLAIAYASAVLLLPNSVGVQLLGDSWSSVSAILLPISLAYLGQAVTYPAIEGLRALGSSRRLLATRATGAIVTVACMVTGAALYGAEGGAIGICAARWGLALLWQVSLRAALARRPEIAPAPAAALTEDREVEEELIVLDGESLP